MTDSRQRWLESLAPHVRAEVEAGIADYEDPNNVEYVDDDWRPAPDVAFKVVPDPPLGVWFDLEFTQSECAELMQAVGDADPFAFIKAAALNHAREMIVEREASNGVTAAD